MTELPIREIHLPDPISWWPLAFGWWLVLAASILFLILGAMIIRKLLKATLRKEAFKALDLIEKSYKESDNGGQCLVEISALLRRVVLSRRDSFKSGGITGRAWLEFLDQSLKEPEFSQGAGQILLSGPYQRDVNSEEVSKLLQLCRKWVKAI